MEFIREQKTKVTLNFADGTTKEIITDVMMLNDFEESDREGLTIFKYGSIGVWIVSVSPAFREGKELAEDFLTVSKV